MIFFILNSRISSNHHVWEAVQKNFIDEVETLRDNDMDEEERAIVMEKFMNMYETQDSM